MEILEDEDLYKKVDKYIAVLRRIIAIALVIVRDGLEGKKIGTMFVIGDSEKVIKRSQSLILDPFKGYPLEVRSIHRKDMQDTIIKLSYIDGAFIISDDGHVVSAGRYINPKSFGKVSLEAGTRHVTGAAITSETNSVVVIVSSSGNIQVYTEGKLIKKYKVELRLRECGNSNFKNTHVEPNYYRVPIMNSSKDNHIYPVNYLYTKCQELQAGGNEEIVMKNYQPSIIIKNNNQNLGYWFVCGKKLNSNLKNMGEQKRLQDQKC
jgi:hypothetical protein